MLTIVQVGRQPAIWCRKCSSTFWPCWVCITSGCHCTPAIRRSSDSNAATGVTSVPASTRNPSGAAVTESPWDIHTVCSAGMLGEQGAGVGHGHRGPAVLPRAGVRDLAAQALGHQLEAVAHPEHGYAGVEERRVEAGRALGVDRGGPAGEDHGLRLPGQDLGHRHRVRHDLGVDPRLADPPGDQLGVLGAEVDDEDQVVLGGGLHGVSLVALVRGAPRWLTGSRDASSSLVRSLRAGYSTSAAWVSGFARSAGGPENAPGPGRGGRVAGPCRPRNCWTEV